MSVAVEFGRGVGAVSVARRRHLRVVSADERAPIAAPRPVKLRMTMLGRRVLACLVVAVVLCAAWNLLAPLAGEWLGARAGSFSGPTAEVVVLPGESLWSIARTAQPEVDPRDTVLQIQQLNQLADSEVVAGQRLVVPAGG